MSADTEQSRCEKALVWSFGGGVQSAAIGVLVRQGKLPQPDLAVIADTGRESQVTWTYMREHLVPFLGFEIQVAPSSLAAVGLRSGNGDILIPAFTSSGKLKTFCSTEWKRRVVRRYLRNAGIGSCRMWLGISTDEVQRAKPSGVEWIEHHFPLLFDHPMTRAECVQLVLSAGLPMPPRSSCWCCPHRSDSEWRGLPADEFQMAVELEREIRATDEGIYLHRSRQPLDQVDLVDRQGSVLEVCDGYCWT